MILGGDYSLYDRVLDWVNHNWKYAFIKASEGILEDPMFKQQWTAARGYIYRGAYHFFRPLVPWKAAADKFLLLLEREGKGELPPVLDFEATNGVANNKICEYGLEWLQYVHRELGVRPIVYTSPGFSNLVKMYLYPEYSDYILWQATYPWDTIEYPWTEEKRKQRLYEVIIGIYKIGFPVAARPWQEKGRTPTFWQFTGKCPPEFVPGYPLGNKLAVDVNFYKKDLLDLISEFNLPKLEGGTVSTKPITWTGTLRAGQTANLRSGAGREFAIRRPVTAPSTGGIVFRGTGVKIYNPVDGYYWGEVIMIGDQPETGFIAFTTSFGVITWLEDPTTPPPPAAPTVTKVVTYFDDDTSVETFPR